MAKKKDKGHEAEAAPEGEPGAEGEAPAKKKIPLKMMIIAGAGAVLILGGGGTAAMMLLGGKKAEAHGEKEGEHKKAEKKEKKKEGGEHGAKAGPSPISEGPDGVVFYAMPDLVVNIQASDGRPTFLKLKLSFELPDEETAEAIEPNKPRLNDMFQTFLRELRPEDLAGSQGSYQLRMEVLRRVNLVIAPAKVNAVLVQEMLIQ
ncbi:MAG: flagellar basal body-associated FliL family protein [Caulobacteraceae bacterium]